MNRLYPELIFVDTATLDQQLEKICEEFREVIKAEGLGARDGELADLEQTIQTYFDIREKAGVSVDDTRRACIEKNQKRGYVKEENTQT